MSIYEEVSRRDYLKGLAKEYDIDYLIVLSIADLLGSDEDFDGLVSACEDYAELNLN